MTPSEQKALLSLLVMAAFADGTKSDEERAQVRQVAESVGVDLKEMAGALQDVLLKRIDLAGCAAALGSTELRQLAYELALGVIDADGLRNESETRFLADLAAALGLGASQTMAPTEIADTLATLPLDSDVVAARADAPDAGIDRMVLNYAILNGALELLPQSMASMAIIPLQMKMVYRIGLHHGYQLDRGHIKDLLAALGVGLTGQYLEEVGRKLIGGLFGKAAGRMVGSLARGGTSVAFSFATTYALGHVAKRYYAGGRTMSTQMLRDAFQSMLGPARELQQQYMPQIEQQARSVDVGRIVQMVRGA